MDLGTGGHYCINDTSYFSVVKMLIILQKVLGKKNKTEIWTVVSVQRITYR